MENQEISVLEAASQLGVPKQTLFKWVKKKRITTYKCTSDDHNGQAISYISISDFELLASERKVYAQTNGNPNDSLGLPTDYGYFYLIQLEPTVDPGRFKVGFASNLNERLRTHRCSAPFAQLINSWPCILLWEKTAIDCATQGCNKIHTEVFISSDLKKVETICNAFFELMPKLEQILR